MFVVTVNFIIKPDDMQRFMPLMLENARVSLEVEQGCLQFDVCTDPSRSNEVFLYEIYHDKAAFTDIHLKAPHFVAFDSAVADMVASKEVRTFEQVVQ